jgi:hypothetical protein
LIRPGRLLNHATKKTPGPIIPEAISMAPSFPRTYTPLLDLSSAIIV